MVRSPSQRLQKVGECLYRNAHGVYFAWFCVRSKQVKRSLKTKSKELARRRLGELRQNAARLHGAEHRNLHFEEVAEFWLESIKRGVKESTYRRRVVCINQLQPFFKGIPVRSITRQRLKNGKSDAVTRSLRGRSIKNWKRSITCCDSRGM